MQIQSRPNWIWGGQTRAHEYCDATKKAGPKPCLVVQQKKYYFFTSLQSLWSVFFTSLQSVLAASFFISLSAAKAETEPNANVAAKTAASNLLMI
jgi:hypothetical protein